MVPPKFINSLGLPFHTSHHKAGILVTLPAYTLLRPHPYLEPVAGEQRGEEQ